jgi:hypothetical protein
VRFLIVGARAAEIYIANNRPAAPLQPTTPTPEAAPAPRTPAPRTRAPRTPRPPTPPAV